MAETTSLSKTNKRGRRTDDLEVRWLPSPSSVSFLPRQQPPGKGNGKAEVTTSRKLTYSKYLSRDTIYKVLQHLKTLLTAGNLFKVEGIWSLRNKEGVSAQQRPRARVGEGASRRLHLHFFISKPHRRIEGMGTPSQQLDLTPSQNVHLLEERMKFNKTGGGKKKD